MIIVVADDLTGAAEMAGIAWRRGCQVGFVVDDDQHDETTEKQMKDARSRGIDVMVVATDARSQSSIEAEKTMQRVLKGFEASDDRLFKKTDSALRGHIVVEIKAMMKILGIRQTLLLPQNPSKKRTIQEGIYRIDGTDLRDTAFCYDPEYPASTSLVEQVLGGGRSMTTESTLDDGINIADATNEREIWLQLKKATPITLVAGAADLFEVFLSQCSVCHSENLSPKKHDEQLLTEDGKEPTVHLCPPCIIVCGSTQSHPLPDGIPCFLMPDNIYHGGQVDDWAKMLRGEYIERKALAIGIGKHKEMKAQYANRLKETLSFVVSELMKEHWPRQLIIEGGATAYAVIRRMGMKQVEMKEEIASGIVRLRGMINSKNIEVIVKPGSYLWNIQP